MPFNVTPSFPTGNQSRSFILPWFLKPALKNQWKTKPNRNNYSNNVRTQQQKMLKKLREKSFMKRGNRRHKLRTTKQVHNSSRVRFGEGCGWEEGGGGAEDICWGGQSGEHIKHQLWIIIVHICQLLMQPMQFMLEGEWEARFSKSIRELRSRHSKPRHRATHKVWLSGGEQQMKPSPIL